MGPVAVVSIGVRMTPVDDADGHLAAILLETDLGGGYTPTAVIAVPEGVTEE